MLSVEQLRALQQVDITAIDKSMLVDIETVSVNASAPFADRVQQFCEQIKNPYAFRVGDVAVKIEYTQNGRTLRDAITSYLATIR